MATKILAEQNIEQVVKWKWGATCYCKYKDGNWEIFEWASPEITQPTNAEIEAEIPNYQAVLDSQHYQRERAVDYPRVEDQLDDLYHNGIDGWKATIKAVKDKYPKEE
tara:strand:+ start:1197 stop:1520 length:324 start_codon:yes stop_codon:yes gene_type:complete